MVESNASHPDKKTVEAHIYQDAKLNFSLFGLFFVFYLGTAIIQTPACRSIASTPFLGMPLGLFLSLAIFPVSWALIVIFFWKSR